MTPLQKTISYALLTVFTLVFLVPFLWVLMTSIKADADSFTLPPKLFPVLMTSDEFAAAKEAGDLSNLSATYGFVPTLEHYRRALFEFPLFTYLRNTVLIAVLSTLGILVSCSAAGYSFACLRWPDRGWIFAIVIGTMLLPFQITLIPQFILFRWLGWINTPLPLIVPLWFGVPFFIFLLRQFFITLPRELFEAARIDGAGEWRILTTIVMPLSKPALITVGIFAAMNAWNDFFGPLIYLSSEGQKTLALGLYSLTSEYLTEWGLLMAAGVLMILPVVAVFLVAQRYFIEGITMTGLKG